LYNAASLKIENMNQRPFFIRLTFAAVLILPISGLAALMFVTHGHWNFLSISVRELAISFVAVSVVAGIAIWETKPWGFYLFWIYSLALLVGELPAAHLSANSSLYWRVSDVICISLLLFMISRHDTRKFFFESQLRWWERARYAVTLPVQITDSYGKKIDGRILNISDRGCLVETSETLSKSEPLVLDFGVKKTQMRLRGEVVRQSLTPNQYGVMFSQRPFAIKFRIKFLLRRKFGENSGTQQS
jgi:hypothetical protein